MYSTHMVIMVYFLEAYNSVLPKDFFAQIEGQYVLCIPTLLLVSKNPTLR